MDAFDKLVSANRETYLSWLVDYLRHPALAGQGLGMEDGASATAQMLERIGARVEVWRRDGAAPVVFGEAGEGNTTLLVYDHYDVQPAEPLELWTSPPFEPSVRDGRLYARGVSDNRGEFTARVAAVDAWLKTMGPLPLRLKFIVEGEEEIGSPNLPGYVRARADRLSADGILWEGGSFDETERAQFPLGGKGLAYFELHVDGPGYDLHSSNAAVVENPAWRLVQALTTLRDASGAVTVDGLAEIVLPPTGEDLARLDSFPLDPEGLRASLQAKSLLEDDVAVLKRRYVYAPTCNICGIESGYTGKGAKTVLPSHASCKLDFRLVPDLTPEIVDSLLRDHLDRRGFQDVEIRMLSSIRPSRSPSDSRLALACLAAAREAIETEAYLLPMAPWSGPFHLFADELGLPLVSAGVTSYSGSRAHAPDENIRLEDWHADIRFIGRLFRAFAEGRRPG